MDNQVQEKLNKTAKKVKKFLNYASYNIIASDNEEIREYFIKNLSKNLNVLIDYQLYYPKRMIIHEQLKTGHILLLNFEQKVKEYIIFNDDNYSEENEWMAAYDALIGFKDQFSKCGRHTIVIVCDNKMASKLCKDINLRSSMNTFLIDKELSKPKLTCYLLKDDSKCL